MCNSQSSNQSYFVTNETETRKSAEMNMKTSLEGNNLQVLDA